MDNYSDIKKIIKPRRDIKASDIFRNKIEKEISARANSIPHVKWMWGGMTIGASVAVFLLLFLPSGILANTKISAKKMLEDAILAIMKPKNIEMNVEVRTESNEIFEHINPKASFISHDIFIQQLDSVAYWYISKGNRSALKNSEGLYIWLDQYWLGWHYKEQFHNMLGYLTVLMNPEKALESEYDYILSNPEAKYEISEKEGDIYLTIHSMPSGEYSNTYALNTSIIESENIRRYIFDANTYLLKSAKVSIIKDSKEIDVLKVTDIKYNVNDRNLPSIPGNIKFIEDGGIPEPQGIPGLDARETASIFLNAFSNWDSEIIYRFIHPIEAEELFRPVFEGAKLINVGHPFKSGSNTRLMFVPYTLRLKDGQIKKHNLVLANYSENVWSFDGGL